MTILRMPMRRLIPISLVLASAIAPAVALGAQSLAGDGTLALRGAASDSKEAAVTLLITGAVVGQIDKGKIVIDDPSATDGPGPIVTGATRQRDVGARTTLYSGTDIKFKAVGGRYRILIYGSGINLNAIGQGLVRLADSSTTAPNAWYAVNGGDKKPIPDLGITFVLNG
jgi:hypothetical protein